MPGCVYDRVAPIFTDQQSYVNLYSAKNTFGYLNDVHQL